MSTPSLDPDLVSAALEYHRHPSPGKISVVPTKALVNQRDLALAYSPGVAAACEAIVADAGELLEEAALAFHDGLGGERADVAEAQHRRAVGDDADEVATRGQRGGCACIGDDGLAGGGHAG